MLIIDTRDSDSLDRALKTYKKKFEKAGIMIEIRARQSFTKPSIINRTKVLKAVYKENLLRGEE